MKNSKNKQTYKEELHYQLTPIKIYLSGRFEYFVLFRLQIKLKFSTKAPFQACYSEIKGHTCTFSYEQDLKSLKPWPHMPLLPSHWLI